MNIKKFYIKLLIFIFTLTIITPAYSHQVFASTKPPSVAADSAVLMDATTGEILFSKNMNTAYPPASTTKIMTALLTLENCDLDDVVTVGKKPPFADGSKIYIFEGEKIKVKDLLYALLLASANDCAEALAEHIAGSTEEFAKMMNERAKELGAKNTNFVNPHGLYNKNHKTSAYDLALIMREVVKHPEYREISQTSAYLIPPTNKSSEKRPLWNGNRLIQKGEAPYYEYLEAGKTGYTIQSQHSYVASAMKDGHRLIVALVHDSEKRFFTDAVNLLNYGYDNYELLKLYSKGDEVSSYEVPDIDMKIPLLADEDVYIVKNKNSKELPTPQYKSLNLKDKKINKGDYITTAKLNYDDKVKEVKLVSGADYAPVKSVVAKTFSFKSSSDGKTNKTPFILTILLIVLLVILAMIKRVRAKRRRRRKNPFYYK